jgi:gelsolin
MLPEDEKKMYTMVTTRGKVLKTRSEDGKQLIVREIPLEGLVMRQGIVYVLDKGPLYWQYNTKKSTAWARYKAAEYMMYLGQWRVPQTKFQVFGECINRLSCDLCVLMITVQMRELRTK